MIEVASDSPAEVDAGFTLAELLVALALLAVVLSLASGGVRFGVRTWEATRAIDRNAELSATRNLLAACLKTAAAVSSIDAEGRVALAFQGAPDRLSLVCPLGREASALQRVDLHLAGSGAASNLIAVTGPFQRRIKARQAAAASDPHLLVDQVAGLTIRYFGDLDDGGGAKFHDRWAHPGRLPQLVAITLRFADGDRRIWPVLSVAIAGGGS